MAKIVNLIGVFSQGIKLSCSLFYLTIFFTVRIHSIIHVKSVEESRENGRQITDVDLFKLIIRLILSLLSKRKLPFYKQSMCFNHLFDEKP